MIYSGIRDSLKIMNTKEKRKKKKEKRKGVYYGI